MSIRTPILTGTRWATLACAALLACAGASRADEATVTTLRTAATGGDWARAAVRRPIAYSAMEADGYYRVHLMGEDGRDDLRIGGEGTGLPRRHVGPPAWHPSGRYLAVIAEKDAHPGSSYGALPGFGGYSDLWLLAADGSWAKRLLETASVESDGLLFPFFSPDGRRITWTQRVAAPNLFDARQFAGYWVIKVADVVGDGRTATIANVRTFEPGGRAFHEGYGFTPDGRRLTFCSASGKPSFFDEDIYTMDASTGGDVRKLTDGGYNEHGFPTPDGASIVWMSGVGNTNSGTDWWIMKADGSDKRRLTWFNLAGHATSTGGQRFAGFGSFSPDGRRFVGDVQTDLISQATYLTVVAMPADPQPGSGEPGCGTGSAAGLLLASLALACARRRRFD